MFDSFPKDVLDRWKRRYERVLAGETFMEEEYSEIPVENWEEITFNPILENGKVIGAACYSRNITEQRLNIEHLRQAKLLLSEAQQLAKVGNWNVDMVKMKSTGLRAQGLLGVDADFEPSFEAFIAMLHPDDRNRILERIKKAQEEGGVTEDEFRIVRPDGQVRILNGQTRCVLDGEGKPLRMYGISHDITDRKLAEASLQKSEANLSTIFNNTDEGFLLLDTHLTILSFNAVANDWANLLFGKSYQEGSNMVSYFVEERKEELTRRIKTVLDGNVVDYETYYDVEGGTIKWYNVREYPVRNEQGEVLGICIAASDITEKKNSELEKDKMTAEIIQRNKDLEQFAYIVSHNLRAPVANIIGFADVLQEGGMDYEDTKEVMEGLGVSVKRLDNIIGDLNQILQVKREINEIKEHIRFSEIVNDITQSISNLIEKEKVEIITDFTQVDEMCTLKATSTAFFTTSFQTASNTGSPTWHLSLK
ncbi:MAG: PAS domain S-box protein [Saprospiraceae bacterium]|nr:PAS domain S-box protein [Saprospiraceae bacterium]